MSFRKRTKEEFNKSVSDHDYTGGYKFWPWILYVRAGMFFSLLFFFTMSVGILYDSFVSDVFIYRITGIFGIMTSLSLLIFKLPSEYKSAKSGIE